MKKNVLFLCCMVSLLMLPAAFADGRHSRNHHRHNLHRHEGPRYFSHQPIQCQPIRPRIYPVVQPIYYRVPVYYNVPVYYSTPVFFVRPIQPVYVAPYLPGTNVNIHVQWGRH